MTGINFLKKLRNLYLAKIVYRKYSIGSNFHAGIRVRLWAKKKLQIGKNFYIGRDSFIETDCQIGDNVILGNRVAIVGRFDHKYTEVGVPIRMAMEIRSPNYDWKGLNLVTNIGSDVWIGYGATILQGVNIGDGVIVGACSVVTKDLEAYSIYVGNPAQKISNRFESELDLKLHLERLNKE